MQVILNRKLKPIKNGWAAYAITLGIAAHGLSPEVADRNLERAARLFLQPLEREGVLQAQSVALGVRIVGDDDGLNIVLEDVS